MSRVDVIVPCYKYAHFLTDCVTSVLNQSVDVRVLIIDDASPDNTSEVASQLSASDKRVEFRRHQVNRGHIATYNEGLDWAAGEYMLLLSADDLLTQGALERVVHVMEKDPEIGFTFGRAITTDNPKLETYTTPDTYQWKKLSGGEFLELSCNGGGNFVLTPTAVVRTCLQKQLGGYRPELPHTGDLEMWMRFAVHAPVGVLDCNQAVYRVHGQNMHKVTFPSAMTVIQQHLDAYERIFQDFGDRIANVAQLRSVARQNTAIGVLRRAAKMFERGDISSCGKFMDRALEICPELRSEPEWRRLRLKQFLGPGLSGTMCSLRNRLRRKQLRQDLHPFGRCGVFAEM